MTIGEVRRFCYLWVPYEGKEDTQYSAYVCFADDTINQHDWLICYYVYVSQVFEGVSIDFSLKMLYSAFQVSYILREMGAM